jgi:hypothetical protein
MQGLLTRKQWLNMILSGRKTWEIRGNATMTRGRIVLIESGSGTVVGKCDLVDVVGPLSLHQLKANASKIGVEPKVIDGTPYRNTYAWVLDSAVRLPRPIPYNHPAGAVIWVKLPPNVSKMQRVLEVEHRLFGRLEHGVQAAQHCHGQDDVPVLAPDVEVAKDIVGYPPDEVGDLVQVCMCHPSLMSSMLAALP